jgi:hypothetical protein
LKPRIVHKSVFIAPGPLYHRGPVAVGAYRFRRIGRAARELGRQKTGSFWSDFRQRRCGRFAPHSFSN